MSPDEASHQSGFSSSSYMIRLFRTMMGRTLHAESKEPIIFDGASVNRWLKGTERVSPVISRYYLRKRNHAKLADDIEQVYPAPDV